jgi:uncharacterized protein YndB with AHSA1/START domain
MPSIDALTIATPGDREIVFTRGFDAPRHLVFAAMTKPEYLRRWLLGPGWEMPVCEVDLRPGGHLRYLWRNAEGAEMAMNGTYLEVVPNERIVDTERFEFGCDSQAGEQLATTVLTEDDGRTTCVCTVVYPSREARDATLASGALEGMSQSYQRLAGLILASANSPAHSR